MNWTTAWTSTKLPAIDCAVKALRALQILTDHRTFPYDASLDLWRRSWPWISFVNTYSLQLPGFVTAEQSLHRVPAPMPVVALILKLLTDRAARDIIYATPGVRRVIAEAWASLPYYDPTAPIPPDYLNLEDLTAYLLALTPRLEEPLNFEEIADALGGSRHDFATAIIRHTSLAVADGKTRAAVSAIHTILIFLHPISEGFPDFTSALLSCGIISPLVSALAIDGEIPPEPGLPHRVVDLALAVLIDFMKMAPGYTGMVEALRAGLLLYLARFVPNITRPLTDGLHDDLKYLLRQFLPSGLKSFAEIETKPCTQRFSRSVLFNAWKGFKALFDMRVEALDAWEASGRSTLLACDNLKVTVPIFYSLPLIKSSQCAKIEDKQFKELALTTHDKTFLRTLMHADYQRLLQPQVARKIIRFLFNHPNTPFCLHFNYDEPADVIIEVLPHTMTHPTEGLTHQGLAGDWERVACARGRMELHVVRIGLGPWVRELIFPLRTTSTRLHDGLHRITGCIGALTEA
ncbi:hypothetical protein C8F04DRAFT_1328457 [Mycena alexandri]|uniref:Uncharacterized protein n=1 Tax=Mycena alexandri TaxID=1745969 RepID=A0AAD6RZ61_9AGAR|nr:hypothetical protein C8F04DRAFT_1328457 [Mycena alexandri]